MAGEEMLANSKDDRALAAVMFMGGAYLAFDAMSTLNSSPWTHETFSSPSKMKAGHEYVMQAVIVSMAFGTISSVVGKTPWPLVGAATGDAYLYWVYHRAFARATVEGGSY